MKVNQYTIEVYSNDNSYNRYKYYATFEDYDGAPIDENTSSKDPVGWGDTEVEAMIDLLEQF